MSDIRVVVVGHPNTGKTSLINMLTGSSLKIGNFPGVTVDVSEVSCVRGGKNITFIDLPGIYSMDPKSDEEHIACNFLKQRESDYDVILNVITLGQIEKNLHLTIEILKNMRKPMLVALNMSDQVCDNVFDLNLGELKKIFGVKFIKTSAKNEVGKDDILSLIYKQKIYMPLKFCQEFKSPEERGLFIHNKIESSCRIPRVVREKSSIDYTSILDSVLAHPVLGVFSLFIIMFSLFYITFSVGDYPCQLIENFGCTISQHAYDFLPKSFFSLAFSEGLVKSVFMVLSFLPRIMIMLFLISVLEKSGYMTRISFLADGIMSKFGMNGRSVVSMVTGFGCSIPAYMSTRSIGDIKARISTMFAIGVLPCSAKMVLFLLITSALFSKESAPYVMMSIYFSSIIIAMLISLFTSKFIAKNSQDSSGLMLELSIYRLPNLKNIFMEVWHHSRSYLRSIGTTIALLSTLIWLLANIPINLFDYKKYYDSLDCVIQDCALESTDDELSSYQLREYVLKNSVLGGVGRFIGPIFNPLGFDWKMNVSLISAIVAKEVAVTTLGVLYHIPDDAEASTQSDVIKRNIPLSSGISYIIFALVYLPCISATIVFAKEVNSRKYVFLLILITTVAAWLFSFVGYNLANMVLI